MTKIPKLPRRHRRREGARSLAGGGKAVGLRWQLTKGSKLEQYLMLTHHAPRQPSAVHMGMDEILHHFENMGNHCLVLFTRESSFQSFFGGVGFHPSTVCGSYRYGSKSIQKHRRFWSMLPLAMEAFWGYPIFDPLPYVSPTGVVGLVLFLVQVDQLCPFKLRG